MFPEELQTRLGVGYEKARIYLKENPSLANTIQEEVVEKIKQFKAPVEMEGEEDNG